MSKFLTYLRSLSVGLFTLLTLSTCVGPEPAFAQSETRDAYAAKLDTIYPVRCVNLPEGITPDQDWTKLPKDVQDKIRQSSGSGTGTIIAHNRVLTAFHVVDGENYCRVAHKVATVVFKDPKLDVAVLDVDLGDTAVTQIACDGLEPHHLYLGFGYAWGQEFAMQLLPFSGDYADLTVIDGAKQLKRKHIAMSPGSTFPGMSGGPVLGLDGREYAVILIGGQSDGDGGAGYRDLRDTALCATLQPAPKPVVKPVLPQDLSKIILLAPAS